MLVLFTLTVLFVCNLVVPVKLTIRLSNKKWNRNLSDPESDNFRNLSRTIQQNVRFVILFSRTLGQIILFMYLAPSKLITTYS